MRSWRQAAIAAVLLALAAPFAAMAEGGPTPEATARLVAALAAQDCRLGPESLAGVLAAARLDEEEAGLILLRLGETGDAVQAPDGSWQLSKKLCQPVRR